MWPQQRLVGEMLVYCFVIVLLTGAFLTFFYTPSAEEVVYDGSYDLLKGIAMSTAYASVLDLSFDVRGGLFIRHLHQWSSVIFLVGVALRLTACRAFLQALPVIALLVLGALNTVVGYALTDDLFAGRILGEAPIAWWYGAHLLLAFVVAAALVLAWRRAGAQRPRALYFVVICLSLTLLAVLFPLNQIWLHGPSM
ncbi:hypothetical protein [Nonomuraea dietziae]|uniref:hypothetical protein n=1 Tax=Nonomuraea dietziae TaxID=65515 RepID=UPI0033EAF0CE